MQPSLRAAGALVAALWASTEPCGAEFSTRALSDFLEGRIAPERFRVRPNTNDKKGRCRLDGKSEDRAPAEGPRCCHCESAKLRLDPSKHSRDEARRNRIARSVGHAQCDLASRPATQQRVLLRKRRLWRLRLLPAGRRFAGGKARLELLSRPRLASPGFETWRCFAWRR